MRTEGNKNKTTLEGYFYNIGHVGISWGSVLWGEHSSEDGLTMENEGMHSYTMRGNVHPQSPETEYPKSLC